MNQDLGMLGNNYDDDEDDYDGADGGPFREVEIREQDRFLPVANIARIMKKVLPNNAKIAKDAKESIQECVSEFISFITSEASDKCQQEKRKTINGDDILWAMTTLGFDRYVEPLKVYLAKYRESVKGEKPEKKPSAAARAKEISGFASVPSPKSILPLQSGSHLGTPNQSISHMGDGGLKYGGESSYPMPGGYASTSSGTGHMVHPSIPTSIPLHGMYHQGGYHLPNGGQEKTSAGIALPSGSGYMPQLSSPGMAKSPYPSIQPMYASSMIGNSSNSLPLSMKPIPASSASASAPHLTTAANLTTNPVLLASPSMERPQTSASLAATQSTSQIVQPFPGANSSDGTT